MMNYYDTWIGQLKITYVREHPGPAPPGYRWAEYEVERVVHPAVEEVSHEEVIGDSLHLQIDRRDPFGVELGNLLESLNPLPKGKWFGKPIFGSWWHGEFWA